jgi:hypothetical protein
MKFNPARGGHAPGHLRDWFCALVIDDETPAEMIGVGRDVAWLVGQLWDCTDVMPRAACATLDLPDGSTYAMGARRARVRV